VIPKPVTASPLVATQVKTTIKIEEDGKFVSLSDKLTNHLSDDGEN